MKRSFLLPALIATFSFVFSISTASAAPIISNGSFESPSVPVGSFTSTLPTGWTGFNVDVVNEAFYGIGAKAADGHQVVDLNSSNGGAIQQDIAVTPGVPFQLTFAFTNTPGWSPSFGVDIFDSKTLITKTFLNLTGSTTGNLKWTFATPINFTPNDPTVTIRFRGISSGAGGALVDAVSVTELTPAAPEPTSLAVFGLAALAAGAYGWRRRKLAAA